MYKAYNSGFTLLELAIVLFILTLVLAGLLGPLSTQQEASHRADTMSQLKRIREALYGFAIANGRLPCPDTDNDGEEQLSSASGCGGGPDGDLPYADLGLAKNDIWNNRFHYRVDEDFANSAPPDSDDQSADCNTTPPIPPSNVAFYLCSEGDIQIEDGSGSSVATKIPAIVLSEGARYQDDLQSESEDENTDGDNEFVDRDYSLEEDNEFDDMLIWVSPFVLSHKMLEAGMLP